MSIVWRLASGRYPALDGEGARRAGGRWNSAGQAVVYTSESLALCLAESLVHLSRDLPRGTTLSKSLCLMMRLKYSTSPHSLNEGKVIFFLREISVTNG